MFKVTIEEIKTVRKMGGRKWETIGNEEVPRSKDYWHDQGNEPKTRIKELYGYTPEIEVEETETRSILSQCVETLDLAKVIKAINNL